MTKRTIKQFQTIYTWKNQQPVGVPSIVLAFVEKGAWGTVLINIAHCMISE